MNLNKLLILLFVSLFLGCAKDPDTLLPYINGYWEISEVTLHSGSKKEYSYSNTIDYIEITDSLKGFRKKMKPNLLGTYETSKDKEFITVQIDNDSLHLFYKTPYASWKETVINANETQLLIVNANKDMYLYTRHEPIDLDLDIQNK